MALSDEEVGLSGPAPSLRIDPAVQQQRDAEATRLKVAEQNGGAGLVRTSAVIPGSRASPSVLSDADVGLGAVEKPTSGFTSGFGIESWDDYKKAFTNESFLGGLKKAYDNGSLRDMATRAFWSGQPGEARAPFGENEGGAVTGRVQRGGRNPIQTQLSLNEVIAEAKKDPAKFLGGLARAAVIDPELLLLPAAVGVGAKAARGAKIIGAGATGAGVNMGVTAAQELGETGKLDGRKIEQSGALGFGMGAPFGLLGRAERRPAGPTPDNVPPGSRGVFDYEPPPAGPEADPRAARDLTSPLDLLDTAAGDKQRNATMRAYRAVQEGWDLKRTERARKGDKLFGAELDRLMKERDEARQAFQDTMQGEVLPPEAGAPPSLDRPTAAGPGPLAPRDGGPGAGNPADLFGDSPLARQAQGLLRAPEEAQRLLPDERAPLVKEGSAKKAELDAEIKRLQGELKEVQTMSGKGSSAKTQELEGQLKIAQVKRNNWDATLSAIEGMPGWAKTLGIGAAAYTGAKASGQDAEDALALGAAALAVKGKGGMWHSKAMEVLADPIRKSILPDVLRHDPVTAGEVPVVDAWAQKASSSYLNKHMGTETDPLRDIEIPFGEGTKKWGEVTDQLVSKQSAGHLRNLDRSRNANEFNLDARILDTEPIYRLDKFGEAQQASKALKSYLSHVGDYLRQNVPPEKLQQYDLVRAVKETSQNDARVAKEMEKEAANAWKDLPVHKEYPDGFKWVELKLPEKLTEEQARGIRPYTPEEIRQSMGGAGDEGYVATGADGKPITNSYTGNWAGAKSPEEAWLAGQLAREGNQMGHCVGGYCEGVATGESRIFSLRDPKGKSHVTVEVGPEELLNDGTGKIVPISDIQQIKGKQNRAPASTYLPYVQDFVKSGKWGEVGDLENTGLYNIGTKSGSTYPPGLPPELQSIPPRELAAKLGGEGYYSQEEIGRALNELKGTGGPHGERGSIDPKLLIRGGLALGGAALGGYLSDDNPALGAIAGGLLGGILPSKFVRAGAADVAKMADYGLGTLSTRIGNISESLKFRGRELERNVLKEGHRYIQQGDPFLVGLNKLPKEQKAELERSILTGAPAKTEALLKSIGDSRLVKDWKGLQAGLKDLGGKLVREGRFPAERADYFPRIVKDLDGLKEVLGDKSRTHLEEVLRKAEVASVRNRGRGLNEIEQAKIVNQALREVPPGFGQPGYAKPRSVDEITPQLQPFYATPTESYHSYIRRAVEDLETAKFFGRDLVNSVKDGNNFINVESSIGELVKREIDAGKMTFKQAEELRGMLNSRFSQKEPTKGIVQDIKNIANAGLLGNIVSAATQLGDIGTAVALNGLKPSLSAAARQLTGNNRVNMRDFGLVDHISEEFVSTRGSAKALNAAFKWGLFSKVDAVGKNVAMNAALTKFEGMARTDEGRAEIARRYGSAFGDELPQVLDDLKAKKVTDRVEAILFSELSDIQPISKMEMPQGYLDHPNGRVMYMLKTFMIKQMDIARTRGYNEIRQGNVARGMTNLAKFGLALGISGATTNMIQDWILGKEANWEASDVPENVLKTFGWSEYVRDKAGKEGFLKTAAGIMAPPYRMFDDILKADPKAVQYIPLVGKLYYNHMMGGAEKSDAAKEKRQRAKERKELK